MDCDFDAAWAHYHRSELQRRYGAGMYITVADGAVIDWGPDEDDVRARAEATMGEPVYVGPVSSEPFPDFRDDMAAVDAEYERFDEARSSRVDHLRFKLTFQGFQALEQLDVLGQKTEFVDGVVVIDGTERRFADHDYRLMVERGIVSADTVLIAGVIFRRPMGNVG